MQQRLSQIKSTSKPRGKGGNKNIKNVDDNSLLAKRNLSDKVLFQGPSEDLDGFISRTQNLLERVKSSIKNTTTTEIAKLAEVKAPLTNDYDPHLHLIDTNTRNDTYSKILLHPDHDMTDVELLLQGVPEAFDEEPHIDDEMVDHLLKIGGPPPSEIQLPTLHALNQKVMEKLQTVRRLRLSLLNLSIFSARYGVRKEGTYIIIRFPVPYPQHLPCKVEINPTDASYQSQYPVIKPRSNDIVIPLQELYALQDKFFAIRNKKDSLKSFFVGDLDLNHTLIMDINITDELLKDWFQNKNGIEIELFGFQAAPGTKFRGVLMEPVCFARAYVSLQGIVSSSGLDAYLTCDLEADKVTLSNILNRMEALTFGLRSKQAVSTRIGVLSMRVSLLAEDTEKNLPPVLQKTPIFQSNSTFTVNNESEVEKIDEKLNDALRYIPQESPGGFQSAPSQPQPSAAFPQHESLAKVTHFGITVFYIQGIHKALADAFSKNQGATMDLVIKYKLSKE